MQKVAGSQVQVQHTDDQHDDRDHDADRIERIKRKLVKPEQRYENAECDVHFAQRHSGFQRVDASSACVDAEVDAGYK